MREKREVDYSQDLVYSEASSKTNEFGQRLDFDVEHGLYQGKKTAVGFEGIWRAKNEPELIFKVKTTD